MSMQKTFAPMDTVSREYKTSPSRTLGQVQGDSHSTSSPGCRHAETLSLVSSDVEPVYLDHQQRGTVEQDTKVVLDRVAIRDLWYRPGSYVPNICSEKVAKPFRSGALTFETHQQFQEFVRYILSDEREEERTIRWNIYDAFVEFKLPESKAHGQTLNDIIRILEASILNTFFIAGTGYTASQLRSSRTACMYPFFLSLTSL
jgi:hypothetical protein